MTSFDVLYDKLTSSKDLTIWAVYHQWESLDYHEGFKIACNCKGRFFCWDTHELNKPVHAKYAKYNPTQAKADQEARRVVYKFVTSHVDYDDVMEKAWIAQNHWERLEGTNDCSTFLNRELDRIKQPREQVAQPKTRISCIQSY